MDSEIIEFYNKLSAEKMKDDFLVSNYRDVLHRREKYLNDLHLEYSTLSKVLCHPIIVVRIASQTRRLRKISKKLDSLVDSSVIDYVMDDSNLEGDLIEAYRYYKPKRIKEFIEKNPINRQSLIKSKKIR